jgi:hypothetical protein
VTDIKRTKSEDEKFDPVVTLKASCSERKGCGRRSWKLGILRDRFGCTSGVSVCQPHITKGADEGYSRRDRKRERWINKGHKMTKRV